MTHRSSRSAATQCFRMSRPTVEEKTWPTAPESEASDRPFPFRPQPREFAKLMQADDFREGENYLPPGMSAGSTINDALECGVEWGT